MLERGVELEFVDLNKGLSVEELDDLIGERDYRQFLNPRNAVYRERGMKRNPPPKHTALSLMAENPNLIKRPIITWGKRLALGFDETAMAKLVDEG